MSDHRNTVLAVSICTLVFLAVLIVAVGIVGLAS